MKMQGKHVGVRISHSILCWCIGLTLSAQVYTGFSISGTVADSTTNQPIRYASVAIYAIDNTAPLTGVITNDKGGFTVRNLNSGKYILKINFIGYKTYTGNFEITNAPVQLAGPVLMNISTLGLA
jgi:hypothetical protein